MFTLAKFIRMQKPLCLTYFLCISAVTPVPAHADEPAQIALHGKYGSVKALAKFMKIQAPRSHFRLAIDTVPSYARLLPLLPRGTRHKGNDFILPNGSAYLLVKAKTETQEKAAFRSRTQTRQELIERLKQLKGYWIGAVVKIKRPLDKEFRVVGTLDQGIEAAPYLPTGTYTIAVSTTKAIDRFYRIAGRPTLPQPHSSLKPGLRWTQRAADGRWEEVPTTTETGLQWKQRADGYWEEAPVKK